MDQAAESLRGSSGPSNRARGVVHFIGRLRSLCFSLSALSALSVLFTLLLLSIPLLALWFLLRISRCMPYDAQYSLPGTRVEKLGNLVSAGPVLYDSPLVVVSFFALPSLEISSRLCRTPDVFWSVQLSHNHYIVDPI